MGDDGDLLLQAAVHVGGQEELVDFFNTHVLRVDPDVQLHVFVECIFHECGLLVVKEIPVA